ncbi:hypothetical protein TRICI_000961 [Trichomonascus ciferrii]|uniref:Hamartin n=1 Tax=Trichomonascus ciferrii TaxID=44093 RepID=A0A642V9M9_9ASCO|nr:hypothetical protein TRICI_000961 [Trichomonascus ciferrii]
MESTTVKLHDELVRIHRASANDVTFEIKFVECLRLLLPCLVTIDVHKYWFGYYGNPALNSAGQPNGLVRASRKFILAVMLQEDDVGGPTDEDGKQQKGVYSQISDTYCRWILEIHLGISEWLEHISSHDGIKSQERRRFIRMNSKDLLIQLGQKKTKMFLTILNEKVIVKEWRIEALALLSLFVSQQPPYLFTIQETPLLESLYNCLLNDISATALTIASNTLAMTIPHICNILPEKLPMLFSIYGRLACWHIFEDEERDDGNDGDGDEEDVAEDTEQEKEGREGGESEQDVKGEMVVGKELSEHWGWDKLGHYFNLEDDDRKPSITPLFTFLYGLFPANLISFLKKPSKYLAKANFTLPFNDFWDEYEIVAVSKPIFELHVLNPGLISNTVEDELNDSNRWSLLGSATDIASQCLSYYNQGLGISPEHQPPEFKLPFSESPSVSNGHSYLYSDFDADGIDPKDDTNHATNRDDKDTPVDLLDKSVISESSVYNNFGKISHFADEGDIEKRQVVAPSTQAMDDLLSQHTRLFTKDQQKAPTPPPLGHRHSIATISEQEPPNTDDGHNNSSHGSYDSAAVAAAAATARNASSSSRLRTRSGTLSSPGFFPVASNNGRSPNNSQVSTPGGDGSGGSVDGGDTGGSNQTSPRTSLASGQPPQLNALDTQLSIAAGESRSSSITTGIEKPQDGSYGELKGIVSFYQRELLLLKNELDFVSFIEQHSQYRFKKMREKLSRKVVNDESVRHLVTVNSDLKKRLEQLRAELSQSQRNTKTYRKERQKYENEIIKKSKEFRQNALDLKQEKEELERELEGCKKEKSELSEKMTSQEVRISKLELCLAEAQSQAELVAAYKQNLKQNEEKLQETQHQLQETNSRTIEDVTKSHLEEQIASLRLENESLEAELTQQKTRYQSIIDDLNHELSEREARPHKAQTDILEMLEKYKQSSEKEYAKLQAAHEDVSQRYVEMKTLYRKHVIGEEEQQNRSLLGTDSSTSNVIAEPETSLLGFEMHDPAGEDSQHPHDSKKLGVKGPTYSRKHRPRGRTTVRSGNRSGTSTSTSRSKSRTSAYRGVHM